MQKITPNLWFAHEAKEAAEFYTSLFGRGSKITSVTKLEGTPSGEVELVSFTLWDFQIDAMSAGPLFTFNPSISLSVQCHDEAEIDRIYDALKEGGNELMPLSVYPWSKKYGWINDRYGVSWQLNVPLEDDEITDRICPFLMFTKDMAGKAEEAMRFYTSVFPDSKVRMISAFEKGEPSPEGSVKHGEFELFGQTLMALDGHGPHDFSFNEALSLVVRCDSQEELDRYWSALSAVPEAEQCGWLKDKYGVSWQIVPSAMDDMMKTADAKQLARVVEALLQMKRIDLAVLQRVAVNA